MNSNVDNHTILITVNKDIVKPTEGHEVLQEEEKETSVIEEEADDWEAIDVSTDINEWEEHRAIEEESRF